MLVRAEIAALRGAHSPQRQARAAMRRAMERWRGGAVPQAVLADLTDYGAGADLADCPALAGLFGDAGQAASLAGGFVSATLAALAEFPLGHVATPHSLDGATATMLLGTAGAATLTLALRDGVCLARAEAEPTGVPATVSFVPTLVHEVVLAGEQTLRLYRRADVEGAAMPARDVAMRAGDVLIRDGAREAARLTCVAGGVVVLRLQRSAVGAAPVAEVDIASGRILHRASADAADSRRELMAAVLRAMRRTDAAPMLAAMARGTGDRAMRWRLLREALALDTASGFAALSAIAGDGDDPLSAPAGALHGQLIAMHPALERLALCPA